MVPSRRFLRAVFAVGLALVATATAAENATNITAPAALYKLQNPDEGLCRLKGVNTTSDNFKYYVSVPPKGVETLGDACARCVEVHRGDSLSVTAYVLDVCSDCKNGEIKLSEEALWQLEFDPESEFSGKVTYKYVHCPTSFASGNVKACLLEGASNTYIPMQFYDTERVVTKVVINGQVASSSKDAFFYFVNPAGSKDPKSTWYKEVNVTLTSDDGQTLSGSFAFNTSKGCATSTFQFKEESSASGHAIYSAAVIMIISCLMMIIDVI
ncbi:hypothetical protein Poli38472_009806 [Pythium oligandrum]|uniref:Expansin-like EG45 domain-containing protein n=1 Tax=Pythium oligandrum TaxID=41045 RepID=A0A8K1CFZ3_PYTOL|nr:hypothetical protein Poli38472_009806 [Pythium oligandrum]|eukprot:TMW62313.1 hypothetical protein Poli38472_009806 [Pythium oligandrum]